MGLNRGQIGRGAAAAIVAAVLASGVPGGALAESGQTTPRTDDSSLKAATATPAPAAQASFSVTVPTIQATGANVDEATLKAIFTGDIAGNADALAHLKAESIKVPEITVSYEMPGAKPTSGQITYHDIDIENVVDGVAATMSVGGLNTKDSEVSISIGKMTANAFDVGAILGMYGLVPSESDTALHTVYKDLSIAGGKLSTPNGNCTIGDITIAEFKARPLKTPFTALIAFAGEAEAQQDHPSPEMTAKAVGIITDIATAFETSPINFGGVDCALTDDQGKPVTFTIGKIETAGYAGARYPEVRVSNFKVSASDGLVSLDGLTLKPIDYSGAIAALQAANGVIDDAWVEAHSRELVPVFDGLSLTGLQIDVPDSSAPGQRIKASVGSFDLSLASYFNGVPTQIASSAQHLVVDMPKDSSDDFTKQLVAMGLTRLDLSYDFSIKWDKDTNSIKLDKLGVSGANLGSIAVAAVLGNAGQELFDPNPDTAMAAGMGVTVKQVGLDVKDDGLGDILMKKAAADESTDPAAARAGISGMAQGMVMAFLGSNRDSLKLANAISKFLNGGKAISATITAKDDAGLGLTDLQALETDPTALSGKLDIQADAQ